MSTAFADPAFADHFSAVANDYANARPEYPDALFAWIASVAPATEQVWEAGCGSGQASRGLARHFARVHATDPSAAQIAQARAPANVSFAVEPGERCHLPDASVDAVCVAQALHWFDRAAFFAECARVLRPGGVLVAWGYQDIVVPDGLTAANDALQHAIAPYWPPERRLVDEAYAGFDWPFPALVTPRFELRARWTLPRLLGYFASYSASQRYRGATGQDAVEAHAPAFAAAWGMQACSTQACSTQACSTQACSTQACSDPDQPREVQWPLFVHARRKEGSRAWLGSTCSPG